MLGSRITLCRKACGWSQAGLAKRLNVSPSAVRMYEQGRREPPCDILIALAETFDVSVDYLLTGKNAPHYATESYIPNVLQNRILSAQGLTIFSKNELAVLVAALLISDENS